MRKRVRINRRKFITRVSGLVLLAALLVTSILSFTGSLTAEASTQEKTGIYIVQKGDTLWHIAKDYQKLNEDIREVVFHITLLNKLETSDIHPGQSLIVPEVSRHDL